MGDGLRIAIVGEGPRAETLRVALLAENGANRVETLPDGAPASGLAAARPDLIVVVTPEDPDGLNDRLRPLIDATAARATPLSLLSPHPYPFAVKMAAALHRVLSVMRDPADPTDAALLLRAVRRAAQPVVVSGTDDPATAPAPEPAALRRFRHDANNFLGQVMTGVSLLEDDSYPAEVREVAARALASCDLLRRHTDRIAALAGPLAAPERVEAAAVAREAVRRVAEEFPEARIACGCDGFEADLLVAEEDLVALLGELIRNAVEAGGGEAAVVCRATGGPPGGVAFIVQDRGPGFSPEELPPGEPFFTSKNRTRHKGTGLHLAGRIAARIGARLAFLPREGGGTEARIELGAAPPEA